jgi:hypothetical protein
MICGMLIFISSIISEAQLVLLSPTEIILLHVALHRILSQFAELFAYQIGPLDTKQVVFNPIDRPEPVGQYLVQLVGQFSVQESKARGNFVRCQVRSESLPPTAAWRVRHWFEVRFRENAYRSSVYREDVRKLTHPRFVIGSFSVLVRFAVPETPSLSSTFYEPTTLSPLLLSEGSQV